MKGGDKMKSYKIAPSLIKDFTKKEHIVNLRLNDELWEDLEQLCKENKLNKADVIRIAIKNLVS